MQFPPGNTTSIAWCHLAPFFFRVSACTEFQLYAVTCRDSACSSNCGGWMTLSMNNETHIDKPRILIQDKTMDMSSYNTIMYKLLQTAVFPSFQAGTRPHLTSFNPLLILCTSKVYCIWFTDMGVGHVIFNLPCFRTNAPDLTAWRSMFIIFYWFSLSLHHATSFHHPQRHRGTVHGTCFFRGSVAKYRLPGPCRG